MMRVLATLIVVASMTTAADPPTQGIEPGNVLPGPFPAYIIFGGTKPDPKEGGVKPDPKETVQTESRQNFGDPTRIEKHHDLVTRFGLDPVVAVFTREAPPVDDAPLASLIKQLDDSVKKNKNRRLHAFTVFLRLKDEFLKDDERIPQSRSIQQYVTKAAITQMPIALDQADSDRTKKWSINGDDQIVVVVYNSHKVHAKFVYTAEKPLDDAGITAIMAEVQKLVRK